MLFRTEDLSFWSLRLVAQGLHSTERFPRLAKVLVRELIFGCRSARFRQMKDDQSSMRFVGDEGFH